MTTLDQLRMFVSAGETGSFSAAGRVLGKGQSAVSIGISNLEIDLGFELFDRSTRKPHLTQDGERLLPFARAVLLQAEDFDIVASRVFAGQEARIRLAVDDALLLPSLSRVLIGFGKEFPATQLECLSVASPEIPGLITSGGADIGLMFSMVKVQKGTEQAFIGNLPFVAVSSPDYPLAKVETIGANELLPYRQLLLRSHQGTALDQFPPLSTNVWYATSFHAIGELVMQGAGWAYLPEHFTADAIAAGRLAPLKLRFEHRHWSPPVECITVKDAFPGPAFSWLSREAKNILP
ncbi:LysR family transcriptional regulator [Roseibium marinum]|uniref:LysR family transcriptional regulator n=1 Tax=Roseibium marinum TaxID=281252 RepID=UPI001AD8B055|nr:LysR family transcriptional regulator [Roseibium marinum]